MENHTPAAMRNARRLRGEMSLPEVLLWRILRQRPSGIKFRRQHPIGDYVVDFCCAEHGLVVEVDGKAHDMGSNPRRDERRSGWLRSHGLTVIHIPATDVLSDAALVAASLVALCVEAPPPSVAGATATSPGGGGF